MQTNNSHNTSGRTKTLLIILGVIIALVMTISTKLVTAESLTPTGCTSTEDVRPNIADESSEVAFNSGTRVLHLLAKHSPFLNTK